MKREIASRKLKRKCGICSLGFKKGDVYYRQRKVYAANDEISAYEYTLCPRCKYKKSESLKRFIAFIEKCHHPITDEVWSTIPGESAVMQPDHVECMICGEWL
ncbi:hypothetical protein ACFSMW_13405 [Virgibacillus halophilus]|uniref:hypothetical protein n=1 Tax=Tigheibacillus halophilus TaxID=361280 RepID=UPI003645340C